MALQRIEFAFHLDGTLRGRAVRDWPDDGSKTLGNPRPMTEADLAAIGDLVGIGYERALAEKEAEIERLKTEHAEQLAAMQSRTSDGDLADRLATIYNTLAPAHQVAFSGELVMILGLLDRGRIDLAAARLAQIPVPPELEAKRAEMLAALSAE